MTRLDTAAEIARVAEQATLVHEVLDAWAAEIRASPAAPRSDDATPSTPEAAQQRLRNELAALRYEAADVREAVEVEGRELARWEELVRAALAQGRMGLVQQAIGWLEQHRDACEQLEAEAALLGERLEEIEQALAALGATAEPRG